MVVLDKTRLTGWLLTKCTLLNKGVFVIIKLMLSAQKTKSGFTIVELLIVIAVMVILSAIVAVAYSGVRGLAIESMLKSSLGGAA